MAITLNEKDDGYRGIWYANQPSNDEYVFKYSGGLGTYCAKHIPFAVYAEEVKKTFFCYGGTTKDSYCRLLHMVSYYDHITDTVPKPTILLDKNTDDAHDNPVISIDSQGYIWIFSTSHGTARPSYIHRSTKPYNIDKFEQIDALRLEDGNIVPFDNFSYMQVWSIPQYGFAAFMTHYNDPAKRTSFFITSRDGRIWSQWRRLAAMQEGHYQISTANNNKVATAFNYHPTKLGLNWRTNLYYMESYDMGKTWQTVNSKLLGLPLTEVDNPALVYDYRKEELNVYLKDIQFDKRGNPIILYLTSKGYESGPKSGPRIWKVAYWAGKNWKINSVTQSDSNYDMGSLYIEGEGTWRIIAPTEPGPQRYNPGGEVAMWLTENAGKNWTLVKQLTKNSEFNHTYVRRPVNAHPEFYALWADGNPRKPSPSRIYFCDKAGNVRKLPEKMESDFAEPIPLKN